MAKRIDREENNLEDQIKDSTYNLKEAPVEFISTGSTMLNLAGSQKGFDGGWARGRIINIVGDESTGKTLFALEACHWVYRYLIGFPSRLFPKVKNVEIDYNNREGVLDFPIAYMYGEDFEKAINLVSTTTAEEAGRYCSERMDSLKKGTAMIHVIDSWDALSSEEDEELFDQSIKDRKPIDGSFHLGKQRFSSKFFFKRVSDRLKFNEKDFTLFVLSQTRDRIGVTFGKKKYRAGGAALNFYSHQICWLYNRGYLDKTVEGEKLSYGISIEGRFEKNKTAKPFRKAPVDILFDYGVDDISSMVDWYFGSGKDVEYQLEGMKKPYKQKEPFIQRLIADGLIDQLRTVCEEKWHRREEEGKVERPPKYL